MRFLLDVNAWIALLDEAHVFHAQAVRFVERRHQKIATCPIVENGVLRVLNLPGYSSFGPVGFEPVRAKLLEIYAGLDHEFWPDAISLLAQGTVNWSRVMGHNQITDAYLLALVVAHDGCLATFDHRVARSVVTEAAPRHLLHL